MVSEQTDEMAAGGQRNGHHSQSRQFNRQTRVMARLGDKAICKVYISGGEGGEGRFLQITNTTHQMGITSPAFPHRTGMMFISGRHLYIVFPSNRLNLFYAFFP